MSIRPVLTSAGAAVVGCLLTAPAALAAGGENTPLNLKGGTPANPHAASSASGGIVRTIVGLAVVLAVIYGLYWVLKQVKASKEEKASGQGLAPLATLPLGGNRSLALVRSGHEVVLVGIGDGSVTPIRTYGEAEARAMGLVVDEPVAEPVVSSAVPTAGWWTAAVGELRRRTVIR